MKLILASSSPRRRELLSSIGITPDKVISPDVDETPLKSEPIRQYVQRIALDKARAIHKVEPGAFILAADTSVALGRQILLKPIDRDDAYKMLQMHSGRRHRVYTAVCAISPTGQEVCRTSETRISMKRLDNHEIEDYLASNEWEGKAGGYSIQGMAAKYIKSIAGSYSNVVGLPLYETDCVLRGLGYRG